MLDNVSFWDYYNTIESHNGTERSDEMRQILKRERKKKQINSTAIS